MLVQEGIRTREHVRVCNARSLHYGALARQTSKWRVFWPVLFMYKISVSHACLLATLILCWLVEEDVANLNLSNQNMSKMHENGEKARKFVFERQTYNQPSERRSSTCPSPKSDFVWNFPNIISLHNWLRYVQYDFDFHVPRWSYYTHSVFKILAWYSCPDECFHAKLKIARKQLVHSTAYSYFFVLKCVFRNHDLEFCRARTQCVVLHTLVLMFS